MVSLRFARALFSRIELKTKGTWAVGSRGQRVCPPCNDHGDVVFCGFLRRFMSAPYMEVTSRNIGSIHENDL